MPHSPSTQTSRTLTIFTPSPVSRHPPATILSSEKKMPWRFWIGSSSGFDQPTSQASILSTSPLTELPSRSDSLSRVTILCRIRPLTFVRSVPTVGNGMISFGWMTSTWALSRPPVPLQTLPDTPTLPRVASMWENELMTVSSWFSLTRLSAMTCATDRSLTSLRLIPCLSTFGLTSIAAIAALALSTALRSSWLWNSSLPSWSR